MCNVKKNNNPPPIGPIGGGLFHIGEGCYTGLNGWVQFETELIKEINNWVIDE